MTANRTARPGAPCCRCCCIAAWARSPWWSRAGSAASNWVPAAWCAPIRIRCARTWPPCRWRKKCLPWSWTSSWTPPAPPAAHLRGPRLRRGLRSGRPGTHLPARGPARPLRGSHRRAYRRPRPLYAGRGSVRQGAAARHVLPSPSKRLRHIHKKASRPSRPAHPAGAGPSAFSGTPLSRGRWPAVPDRDTAPPNIKISPACCPADGARPFFKLGGKRSVLPRQRPYCITFTGTSGARRTIPSMMTCSPALSSPSTTLMSPDSKRMFTLR